MAVPVTKSKSDPGFVVRSGTIGGLYNRDEIMPSDAFPEERIIKWLASGVIEVATEKDVEKARGVPSGIAALGSLAEPAPAPIVLAEMNAATRLATIEALRREADRLEEEHDRLTDEEMERAEIQSHALDQIGVAPETPFDHSGAASTADNTPDSGQTPGGGEPSEPVDPAKQTAARGRSTVTPPPDPKN